MKRLIRAALGRAGLQISRKQSHYARVENFFNTIKKLGFEPQYIIDVGANHGNWTRAALLYFPSASITMIEPQEHLKADVQDLLLRPDINWITAGAGSEDKMVKFSVGELDHSSTFVYSEHEASQRGLKQIDMRLVTLNTVVADGGGKMPDLLKIDAEGLDLDVIDGAGDLMGHTEVILLEAAVCAQDISNRFSRAIIKMDALGYEPFDITDLNYSRHQGVLWLIEIAFVRKGGALMSKVTGQY